TSAETNLSAVEEWKRKGCDVWIQSNDSFALLSMKVFDFLSAILKSSEPCDIQRTLESLRAERQICLKFEKKNDPSIQSLMFGIIETFEFAILHLI
ncbi:hypothetical protein PMAYCL1PPCAC_14300, partial [Pristionchus mayeri]